MDDSIDSKSKPLCLLNIWIKDIDNEINDPRPIISITKKINIEHYDYILTLLVNHVMDQTKNHNF
jgi:hypothetical protein